MNCISHFSIIVFIFSHLSCDTNPVITIPPLPTGIFENGEVTDLTEEAWEKIEKAHEFGYEHIPEFLAEMREKQRDFYNRYIDADGIAIVGNENTLDAHFVNARKLILIATAKRPELRDPFRHSFYAILLGGSTPPEPTHLSTSTRMCYHTTDFPSAKQMPEHLGQTYILGGGSLSINQHQQYLGGPEVRGKYTKTGYIWGYTVKGKDKIRCAALSIILHEFVHAIISVMKRYDPTFEDKWNYAYDHAQENNLWWFTHYTPRVREFHHFMTYVLDVFYFEIGEDPDIRRDSRYDFKTVQDFIEYDPIVSTIILEWFTHAPMQELFSPHK